MPPDASTPPSVPAVETDAGSFDAAVALLTAEPEAPTPEPAPVPVTPPATPEPAPAEETPAAPVDPGDKLLADLEARRAARAAKPQGIDPVVAQLQAELAALKAQMAQPQTQDFAALVREHGEVEALRKVGIDPIEYFGRFKERAKQQNPMLSKAEQDAAAARAGIDELRRTVTESAQAQQQRERARYEQETEAAYHRVIADPALGLTLLPKMTIEERMEETRRTAAALRRQGYTPEDFQEMTDGELAQLTEKSVRDRIRRLTGDPAGAAPDPKTVPATDGAKTTPAKQPVSLTNDLASQFTGGRKLEDLNDRESFEVAMRVIQSGTE